MSVSSSSSQPSVRTHSSTAVTTQPRARPTRVCNVGWVPYTAGAGAGIGCGSAAVTGTTKAIACCCAEAGTGVTCGLPTAAFFVVGTPVFGCVTYKMNNCYRSFDLID